MSLFTVLLLIIASAIFVIISDCKPSEAGNCPLIEFCVGNGCKNVYLRNVMLAITIVISLFFCFPVAALCYVHIRNYSASKTTNERFTKNTRSDSEVSEDFGSVADLRANLLKLENDIEED